MLCYGSEIVDDVLLEALLLGLCSGTVSRFVFWEPVLGDVLVEALFVG